MLTEKYDQSFLEQHLKPLNEWNPLPRAKDREAWKDALKHDYNRRRRDNYLDMAQAYAEQPWPQLPATLFMLNERTGNRSEFENPYFSRRGRLGVMTMAECFEYKGRFIDDIINAIWSITEEATWAINAHAYRADHPDREGQDALPDQREETLALFSVQTAMVLAETIYLLHDELYAISPNLIDRVQRQIMTRIIEPFENNSDEDTWDGGRQKLWWMCGRNNWTPWCCSNLLGTAMYLLDDTPRLAKIAVRLMGAVDRFIGTYGPDGGCDEGPGYWGVAAGRMLRFLELLYERTDGAVSIYDEPLIKEMGLYIVRAHLTGNWYTNFADAPPQVRLYKAAVYRYGERVGAPAMQKQIWYEMLAENRIPVKPRGMTNIMALVRNIFWMEADTPDHVDLEKESSIWLPDLQFLVSRDSTADDKGFILAAKAGHNGENHNHNDVGQFILMADGKPVIIDAGTERYTAKTFSSERYTLWTHRSTGHNVPLPGGVEQTVGKEHAASDVSFSADKEHVLSMELKGCYPEDTPVDSLKRTITHVPGETVTVADALTGGSEIQINLWSPIKPDESEGGLVFDVGSRKVAMIYGEGMTCEVLEHKLEDPNQLNLWGKHLYHIVLTSGAESELIFRIEE